MLKVIGGTNRGRYLKSPRGLATRPTTSRVRASIFSRLAARIDFEGRRVLDLFAGSGSLGIEALSRGAQNVVFVDSSRAAVESIRRNLQALGLIRQGRIERATVARALSRLAARGEKFSLVFMDPPYGYGLADQALRKLVELNLLENGAWIVVEISTREEAPCVAGLERVGDYAIGDHRLLSYTFGSVASLDQDSSGHSGGEANGAEPN